MIVNLEALKTSRTVFAQNFPKKHWLYWLSISSPLLRLRSELTTYLLLASRALPMVDAFHPPDEDPGPIEFRRSDQSACKASRMHLQGCSSDTDTRAISECRKSYSVQSMSHITKGRQVDVLSST